MKPKRTPWQAVKENVETTVAAVVVALVIRQYVVEPYKIPTGSMGPSLHGVHRDIRCPSCGQVFETGCEDSSFASDRTREVSCPDCGTRSTLGNGALRRGDKILANKLIYLLRPPRRWEVVVFHYAEKTYIKRLAGLPGEKLEVRHGDLYIDDRIAERPAAILRAMQVPVYDLSRDSGEGRPPAWRFDPAQAVREGGGFLFRGPEWADLTYARGITDWLCYNDWDKVSASKLTPVGDLRVEMDCEVPAGGGIGCEIQEDGHRYRWTLGDGAKGWQHEYQGSLERSEPLAALAPGRHRLVFSNIDDVQSLEVDGSETWRAVTPVPDISDDEGLSSGLRILGRGGAKVTGLSVFRDSAYSQDDIHNGRKGTPILIPPGRYFFLGDNSLISADSRKWYPPTPEGATVPESDILGKAFLAVVHLDLP